MAEGAGEAMHAITCFRCGTVPCTLQVTVLLTLKAEGAVQLAYEYNINREVHAT